jgi:alkylresorcinol/alkylpyrone synthase
VSGKGRPSREPALATGAHGPAFHDAASIATPARRAGPWPAANSPRTFDETAFAPDRVAPGSLRPALLGLGHATPPRRVAQAELAVLQADRWGLRDGERALWERIVRGSGVESRAIVADVERILAMGTAERMAEFARHAPPVAIEAARAALAFAGVGPREITDLVTVSCTGFSSPGVGHALVDGLGLSRSTRVGQVGFMGCFGGVVGLRMAAGLAAADPAANVLVCCVELCSLHFRPDRDPQNLVASALFADGAAAAVVAARPADERGLGAVSAGRSRLLPEGREAMTWTITDAGFAMTLSREVPPAIAAALGPFLAESPAEALAVHPGGPGVLDAVEAGIAASGHPVDARSIPASRAVLRDHGNMSSGSVLFTLGRLLAGGVAARPVDLLAFGPGLTVDSVRIG